MRVVVVFITVFVFFCYFVVVPKSFSATTIINPISIDTSSPIIGDAFNLMASISGALSGSNYYIKCRIGTNASLLNDGQTYNAQTSQWLDDTGSTGAWIDMPQITAGSDGLWQDSIKCRIKTSANDEAKIIFIRACLNSNNSCGTSFQSANSLAVNPIFPTPTPTLTPTPTSTPTNTPAPTSTPSPTNTPTPIKTLTSTPRVTAAVTNLSAAPTQGVLSNSVLGENTASELSIPPPENNLISGATKKPDTIFQRILMMVGIVFIAACVILTIRAIKKGELTQNEEE